MDGAETQATLTTKREELVARIAAIRKDLKTGLDANLDDQAIQLENYEVLQRLLEQAADEIARIDQQLAMSPQTTQ